jgi:flagellar motor protein MotB
MKKIPAMSKLPSNKESSLKDKTGTKKAMKVTFDKAAIERKNGKRTRPKPTRRRVKANPIREMTIVAAFFLFTFLISHVAKQMVTPGEDAGNTGSLGKSRSRHRTSDRVLPRQTSPTETQDIPQHSEFQELKELMERQQIQLEQQQRILEDQKLQIEKLTAELDINEKEEAHEVCLE